MRGPGLDQTMSRYLIDRIASIDGIEILTHTEVVALYGSREGQLERVRWRNNLTGEEIERAIRHVFLFIGADPATAWLKGSGIALDNKNFITTGSDNPSSSGRSNAGSARPLALETNVRAVYSRPATYGRVSQARGCSDRRGRRCRSGAAHGACDHPRPQWRASERALRSPSRNETVNSLLLLSAQRSSQTR